MRRWLPPDSLHARLLALVLGLLTGVWLLAAVLTWHDARHELDELLDGHLAQAAALLVVQQAGLHDDDEEVSDVPVLHKYAPRVAFQVFHEQQLIRYSAQAGTQPMSALRSGFATVVLSDGTPWRVFSTPGAEPDIQIHVGERIDARRDILRAVLRGMLLPLALALPLLALALWWAVRRGLRPVRRLLGQRQPHALEPVVLDQLPAEMQPLVAELNSLFERIEQLLTSERRFTADAAHELRTPIAAIRAQAQVALGAGGDAAQRTQALHNTLAGCDRATHLVEQLLQLARLEQAPPGPPATDAAPLDLAALAQQVAAELAPQALTTQQTLTLDAPARCAVSGAETLWRMLLRNLLDNALRYSPPGARIRVAVAHEASGVLLTVEDSGPGLSAEQISRLGERFFRVLGSEQPGSGLGWSIVRRVAQVLGTQIAVTRSPELGGLRVMVSTRHGTSPHTSGA
jgi:two-component system sensor histidine kinase QseC